MTDTGAQEYALASVAESYAKAWQFEKALQIANRITETWRQEQALAKIAKSLATAEEYARARQVANRITNTWTKEQRPRANQLNPGPGKEETKAGTGKIWKAMK